MSFFNFVRATESNRTNNVSSSLASPSRRQRTRRTRPEAVSSSFSSTASSSSSVASTPITRPSPTIPTSNLASRQAPPRERPLDAYLAHAGQDKMRVALPLFHELVNRHNMTCFLDHQNLPIGQHGPSIMERAMHTALMGVFILSPEFLAKKWPIKELCCFLNRYYWAVKEGRTPPLLLPVFYRLEWADCDLSWDALYRKYQTTFDCPTYQFHERVAQGKTSPQKIMRALRKLKSFTGVVYSSGLDRSDHTLIQDTCVALVEAKRQHAQSLRVSSLPSTNPNEVVHVVRVLESYVEQHASVVDALQTLCHKILQEPRRHGRDLAQAQGIAPMIQVVAQICCNNAGSTETPEVLPQTQQDHLAGLACQTLCHLAEQPETRFWLVQGNGIPVLVRLIGLRQTPQVQESGCWALAHLAEEDDDSTRRSSFSTRRRSRPDPTSGPFKEEIVEAGGAEALIQALQREQNEDRLPQDEEEKIQWAALWALARLAHHSRTSLDPNQYEYQSRIARFGGLRAVIDVLVQARQRHNQGLDHNQNNRALPLAACWVLWHLTTHHEENLQQARLLLRDHPRMVEWVVGQCGARDARVARLCKPLAQRLRGRAVQ